MNYFKYTNSNKRYYTLDYFYKNKFGSKVFKVSLNGGFSCPNKDGKVGFGGCIYCSKLGSGEFAGDKEKDLEVQFEEVKKVLDKKWPNSKYIAYFQANTNTYASVEELKEKYEKVLKIDNVIGLSISTRPDSISDECLDYLEELSNRTYLTVELGLQTIHEKTSKLINRCHSLECFLECVKRLREKNINVVVHIINGLPYETKDMMVNTVKYLNKLDIQGIKIHMLHIVKDTKLALMYKEKPFKILTKEEYVDIVCTQLENLKENIVIHRITGDPKVDDLIEPAWVIKKFSVLNDIDKELEKRDTYQGFNKTILNYVKREIDKVVKYNDKVVDATIGNGHDTLNLCEKVYKGHVFGFDIQDEALDNTRQILQKFNNYTLYKKSHEYIYDTLKEYDSKISLVIFNLGYLPGGDKSITTSVKSTIKGIDGSIKLLNNKGKLLVVIYPGHEEGKLEEEAILDYINKNKSINYKIYRNTDNKIAPYLVVIERKKDPKLKFQFRKKILANLFLIYLKTLLPSR